MKVLQIRKIISISILTLLMVVLFGLIFLPLNLVERTPEYWFEVMVVIGLLVISKINSSNYIEATVKNSTEIKEANTAYDKFVEENVKDVDELNEFVKVLDEENKKKYIKAKLKNYTEENYERKHIFMPKTFEKFKNRIIEKSEKIRPINDLEVYTRTDAPEMITSKNLIPKKKWVSQIVSTMIQVVFIIIFSHIAYQQIILSGENVFKFMTYTFMIINGTVSAGYMSYRIYRDGTFEYLSRLEYIVERFKLWKKNKGGEAKCHTEKNISVQKAI